MKARPSSPSLRRRDGRWAAARCRTVYVFAPRGSLFVFAARGRVDAMRHYRGPIEAARARDTFNAGGELPARRPAPDRPTKRAAYWSELR